MNVHYPSSTMYNMSLNLMIRCGETTPISKQEALPSESQGFGVLSLSVKRILSTQRQNLPNLKLTSLITYLLMI